MSKTKKIVFIVIAAIVGIYVSLVIVRMFHFYNLQKTEEQVAKIHATKLTLDDVIGKNLPPDPGEAANATIEGVDVNKNGIRDDVELAIFKEYPNSAKTRAVLLQYALALQMEMTQSVVNEGTVGAVSNIEDSAFFCITKIVSGNDKQKNMIVIQKYQNFVLNKQLNTDARTSARDAFYKHLGSGSIEDSGCDIDITTLSN